mgnify:FL=1|jgi:hypothetical protein
MSFDKNTQPKEDGFRFTPEQAFQLFKERIATQEEKEKRNKKLKWSIVCSTVVLGVVLSVALITCLFVSPRLANTAQKGVWMEVPMGSTSRIVLPDGSIAHLNENSHLTYSHLFGIKNREIKMSGECYFEVKKNEKQPFIVFSDAMKVQVLGTKFNVRDYPNSSHSCVALLEGKVTASNIKDETNSYELRPNQQITLDKHTGEMQLEDIHNTKELLWTSEELALNGKSLTDITYILSQRYHVNIVISNDSMRKLRFGGSLSLKNQHINEVLDVLKSTGKIRYRTKNNTIVIY